MYERFYEEELASLKQELKITVKKATEDTIDEKVRKALLERPR